MIPNRQTLLATIGGIVTNGGIAGMNTNAQGPQLTLYLQTRALRQQYPTVSSFLACSTCVRSIYDTLISWGMNTPSHSTSMPAAESASNVGHRKFLRIGVYIRCL